MARHAVRGAELHPGQASAGRLSGTPRARLAG